jgi:hypothetical protein
MKLGSVVDSATLAASTSLLPRTNSAYPVTIFAIDSAIGRRVKLDDPRLNGVYLGLADGVSR